MFIYNVGLVHLFVYLFVVFWGAGFKILNFDVLLLVCVGGGVRKMNIFSGMMILVDIFGDHH